MRRVDTLAIRNRACSILAVLVLMPGCFLARAHRNTNELATIVTLRGTVKNAASGQKLLWVVLLRQVDHQWVPFSHRLLHGSNAFEFSCVAGRYTLFAFEDQNEDRLWEPGEPAAHFGSGEGLSASSGQALAELNLTVGPFHEDPGFVVSIVADETVSEELVKVHRGDIASLADDRFSREAGERGLWQPVDFALKWGVGVSFLEPFSTGKIPVLFVHGAGGSPSDFTSLIGKLDRTRFQPWVFSYPSGIRLALASSTFFESLPKCNNRSASRNCMWSPTAWAAWSPVIS